MAKTTAQEYRETVAQVLIDALEQGVAPWQMPWDPTMGLPHNPVSALRNDTNGKYRGGNTLYLQVLQSMKKYNDPRWVTFNQAVHMRYGSMTPLTDAEFERNKKLSWNDPNRIRTWQVRKGERGTLIEKWGTHTKTVEGPDGEEERSRMFFRPYIVFNASQIDGVPPYEPPALKYSADERYRRVEKLIERAGVKLEIGAEAYYTPATDTITMPPRHSFRDMDSYFNTLLHETAHWTGHATRLNRDFGKAFRHNEHRAAEELRAEIGSMLLSHETGIPHDVKRHAAYVGSWLRELRDDPNEIFAATRDAHAITDFVMAFELKLELGELGEQKLAAPTLTEPAAESLALRKPAGFRLGV
jgi:antirestriction protein ArdC